MVVDRRDGHRRGRARSSPGKARILLDSGAYASDTPVLGQLAAMMVAGPYRIPAIDLEALCVYTNRTPSGSVRAPTGPQACWAIEQHHDVLAARVGLDPVEFRRRNLVHHGDEGPTCQQHEGEGAHDALETAARRIGCGEPLGPGEAIGVASGWWFSNPAPSGAWVRLESDGSGRIVTGAQENGTGAVMALPILAAEVLGMDPGDFAITYQDTDAGPYDGGCSGSQTTFNNGRAVIEAANEVKRQLLDPRRRGARGGGRAIWSWSTGMRRWSGARIGGSRSRSWRRRRTTGPCCSVAARAMPPAGPEHDATACVGRLGFESFSSPTFFTHAARVRVDPLTGVVRVLKVVAATDVGRVLNPAGAQGQMTGGIVMSLGNALTEGTHVRRRREAAQRRRCSTTSCSPPPTRPRSRASCVEHPATNGGPKGSKGVGEPPIVPTAGAVANAIAAASGVRVRRLPMTPERVWRAVNTGDDGAPERNAPFGPAVAGAGGSAMSVRSFASAGSLEEALAALAADPDARPVAGGTDLVVASRQGRRPLPPSMVAIDRIAELGGTARRRPAV